MSLPVNESNPPAMTAARRNLAISGIVFFAVLVCGGLLIVTGVVRPPRGASNRVSDTLTRTLETSGLEAALAQYHTLRQQGFPGVKESEGDTNRLGYALLAKGKTREAIEIFKLNVETHPRSSNVYDSLGEAALAAGDRALAIEAYTKALAMNPNMKSAKFELDRLGAKKRAPYAAITLVHIGGGLVGILSGAAALCLRKGSRRHAIVGRVFVVSMLVMSGVATYRSIVAPDGDPLNLWMGVLTFYLVSTAFWTARQRAPKIGVFDWAGLLVAAAAAVSLARLGLTGRVLAGAALLFGGIALLAAVLDLRMILRGGLTGTARIVRHVWRVCAGLYIAVGSFFLGQAQVFPYSVRSTGVLAVPPLLVVAALLYWLIRVLVTGTYVRRRGKASPSPLAADAA